MYIAVFSFVNYTKPGFCLHWSAVVGSNHHLAFLTTTQQMFNSIYSMLIWEKVSLATRSVFEIEF